MVVAVTLQAPGGRLRRGTRALVHCLISSPQFGWRRVRDITYK